MIIRILILSSQSALTTVSSSIYIRSMLQCCYFVIIEWQTLTFVLLHRLYNAHLYWFKQKLLIVCLTIFRQFADKMIFFIKDLRIWKRPSMKWLFAHVYERFIVFKYILLKSYLLMRCLSWLEYETIYLKVHL